MKNNDQPETDRYLPWKIRWEMVALIAAFCILATPFVYLSRDRHAIVPMQAVPAMFSGSEKCASCHKSTYDKWRGSHHDLAMDAATDTTVLGDFADAVFKDPYSGVTSRFFRKGAQYVVETEGPDGKPGIFPISYVFGVYPLQQYLVPFPGGRLQCLTVAWDVKSSRWYRLPPYDVKGHTDWLHWANGGQNWNSMCAECHSTQIQKGYDLDSSSYSTTWFEIDVGCEACHGPASEHVKWAELTPLARPETKNFGLVVQTAQQQAEQQVAICAPCHSRRFQLGDNDHSQGELLDKMVPALLDEGLYYPDGQIMEEVYEYGSFTQSKMYRHGVRCSNCHDPHSLKLHKEGNDVCLQCHRGEDYDTPQHHFHKPEVDGKPSEGHLCVKCHMPNRYYMGIDNRLDHSIRIPRPDLSRTLKTPNACSATGCHDNKPLDWVIDQYSTSYGQTRKPHFGEIFAAARGRNPVSGPALIRLAGDSLLPAIVRATALSLLRQYPGEASLAAFKMALQDEDALIRYTAIRSMDSMDRQSILTLIAPKLYDEVKAVRLEASFRLAAVPQEDIRKDDLNAFQEGLAEYRQAMLYNADFAPQRYNLGNLAMVQGEQDKAIRYFEQAIQIDEQFFPAKVNLAMQYNKIGENGKAETLLRQVVAEHPMLYEIDYSLGLLLAERGNYLEAAEYLGKAADGMPSYSRARYNQALALLKLENWAEGAETLRKAVMAEPANEEYFITLVNLFMNLGQADKALALANEVLAQTPGHAAAKQIQEQFRGQ